MKAPTWVIRGVMIGTVTLASLRADGPVEKTSEKKSEPPMRKVLATDIGTRVQIVGRLGYPLGELVTIQGAWIRPPGPPGMPVKDDSPRFTVTHVNGKKLETPVSFDAFLFSEAWGVEEIPRQEGPVWEVRGCETGGFRGTPREVWEDASKGPSRPPAVQHRSDAYGFKFYTGFIYSSSKSLKGEAPAVNADEIEFVGTVTSIEIRDTGDPSRQWVVTLKVGKMIRGNLPLRTFELAVHSPSREWIESGRQYRISVRKSEGGYDYCGRHPWRPALPETPEPK